PLHTQHIVFRIFSNTHPLHTYSTLPPPTHYTHTHTQSLLHSPPAHTHIFTVITHIHHTYSTLLAIVSPCPPPPYIHSTLFHQEASPTHIPNILTAHCPHTHYTTHTHTVTAPLPSRPHTHLHCHHSHTSYIQYSACTHCPPIHSTLSHEEASPTHILHTALSPHTQHTIPSPLSSPQHTHQDPWQLG
ncbi:hypothetical protein AALO_G00039530, partial [Alosa alosa]